MSATETYKKVKPSVVAIAANIPSPVGFPEIIGTGYIVRSDGIIFTNKHVIDLINKLPIEKAAAEWPAHIIIFHQTPEGMSLIPVKIEGVGVLDPTTIKPAGDGYNYGPDVPDVGLITISVKDLPALTIAENFELEEGQTVLFSGFPMGTRTLTAPGWVHQLSPTLHQGIISAILPFTCASPHEFLIHAMTQGGASGSPVFTTDTGEVIGMVYGGLIEHKQIELTPPNYLDYINNTSLTEAIPAKILKGLFNVLDDSQLIKARDVRQYDTINSILERRRKHKVNPKEEAKNLQHLPVS